MLTVHLTMLLVACAASTAAAWSRERGLGSEAFVFLEHALLRPRQHHADNIISSARENRSAQRPRTHEPTAPPSAPSLQVPWLHEALQCLRVRAHNVKRPAANMVVAGAALPRGQPQPCHDPAFAHELRARGRRFKTLTGHNCGSAYSWAVRRVAHRLHSLRARISRRDYL